MAGNPTGGRKTAAGKNGRRNTAQKPEQKAAKKNGLKNGRGNGKKANGRSAPRAPAGTLFVIGGAGDRDDTKIILRRLVERVGSGKLGISALATHYCARMWGGFRQPFTPVGREDGQHLGINHRDETTEDPRLDMLSDAKAVFFTGGDQLKITTRLGGTALSERIEEIYRRGGIVAGTSAGATALGEMMLVGIPGAGVSKVV